MESHLAVLAGMWGLSVQYYALYFFISASQFAERHPQLDGNCPSFYSIDTQVKEGRRDGAKILCVIGRKAVPSVDELPSAGAGASLRNGKSSGVSGDRPKRVTPAKPGARPVDEGIMHNPPILSRSELMWVTTNCKYQYS
ncbi:hypothetical protein [Simiduia aestuariiviva]|uniref:Uncharacterized protein n=1 Tax=Simiduia aestuariiviva TaxID=1510459 RepID=A0A839USS3_9GAMM|nr:hypothetical protein [Simiduia aestuariiviva]MBB3168986.1 hypothetical protein [Simiduia aestuariiviva]